MGKFFHNELPIKQDLARHDRTKKDLETKLKELDPNDKNYEIFKRMYINLLGILADSRVEIVDKIGRK
jgi:hypothetical protein